jgi:tetracycline resistance efflux pump
MDIISILPPVIAIVIVLFFKKPLIGLFVGVLTGTLIISGFSFNFFIVFFENLSKIVFDVWNIKLVIGLFLLSGFIGLVDAALHKKEVFSNMFDNKKKTLFMGWIVGLVLFIDDYFNILLNGLFLRSFSKKHGISKEKIAFIIHSLGVSSCVLIPFSTWTIFIIGLLNNLDLPISGLSIFIGSIPFNFYSISLIITTLAVIVFEIDILKMKTAENKKSQDVISNEVLGKLTLKELLTPAAILIFTSIFLIFISMGFNFSILAIEQVNFIDVIIISSLIGIIFAVVYYVKKYIISKRKILPAIFNGFKQVYNAIIVLFLAWFLGLTVQQAGTTNAVISLSEGYLTPSLLIFATFILTALMAFMTSSWTSFAVLIPIMIPLSISLTVNPSYALAAIISGGVFGDHMSPISSTTILTKAVSRTKVHEHFHSQLPYGVISFAISAYLFFLIGGL